MAACSTFATYGARDGFGIKEISELLMHAPLYAGFLPFTWTATVTT